MREYDPREELLDFFMIDNSLLKTENERLREELEALKIDKLNLIAIVEQLEQARAERDSMATALKTRGGCDTCKHCDCEWHQEPCDSCRQDDTYPKWEWRGVKDINVPTKEES